jgi:Na+/proline symporter
MQTAFTALDAGIVLAYLAALALVGVYFSRRQTNLGEFFVARQSMSWLPVGLSLILLAGTSSWIFLYPWVSRVTLPSYRRFNLYTAYEFLEARFDVRVRTLAAALFIVWRLCRMAPPSTCPVWPSTRPRAADWICG